MAIYARFLDMKSFQPVRVSKVYLQIVSNDDEYWKSSLMKQDVYTLQIAIPTLEMEADEYVVKVADHEEMMTFGFNNVRVKCPRRSFRNKNRVKVQMY